MFRMKRICHLIFRLLFLLDGLTTCLSLTNVSLSMPRGALAGEGGAALRCEYDLEGAALYSIRWYRADAEFYRYVPREHPPAMVFPLALPGALVDLTQSDHQQVRIVNLNRRLSGLYQCEVSADAPLFHTDIKSAPFTVVDPPFRAPHLSVSRASFARGDVIRANCSVDEAYPAPNITWLLDNHKIAESVSPPTPETDFREHPASSQLEITVVDGHYKVELSYSSVGLSGIYQDSYLYENDVDRRNKDSVLRYTMIPPPGGQFALSCMATIYDVYARQSDPILIREDAPHPASVTGEDSSGGRILPTSPLTILLALSSLRLILVL